MNRNNVDQSYFVLGHTTRNVFDLYTMGCKLGNGPFATSYLCTENSTGIDYACKSIAKRKLISKKDVENVRREIQILRCLTGKNNVAMIKGAYEDPQYVHIVTEFCGGGELLDRIIQKGHYSERKAAELTKIVVGVVMNCHSIGVMHRDLKPEKFLFVNKADDLSLKAFDFRLSVFFKPGQVFTDVVGSPYYRAPEVVLKNYGPEADVWSAGAILYTLLSGVPPFWAESQQDMSDAILEGQLDFDSDPWPLISASAKDLIRRMLCRRSSKRLTAHEVLRHPWICEDGVAPNKALDPVVLYRLKIFSGDGRLNNLAFTKGNNKKSQNSPAIFPRTEAIMNRDNVNQSYFVLGHETRNVFDLYTMGRKLGEGQFATTYLCTDNTTGIDYACKSIAKRKLISKEDVEDVRREIQILHHLNGQKNVVMMKGAYEDPQYVHIVMELCGGGELFDRITERGHYSERKAAKLTKIVVGVVESCHLLGVMYRDLKPENFLLVNKADDFSLKATDFGLSVFFKPGQFFTDVVGSPYYVAPEVLLKHYGPEADVWSAGVILYILLSGVPPFWAESQQGIFDAVLKGYIDFESDPWPLISASAKDLIRKMLCMRPSKRLTAHEVLCHPWICENSVAPDGAHVPAVLSPSKSFSGMNKLKKTDLLAIEENLSKEEIAGLREMFTAMDTDNSGAITFDELKAGLRKYGSTLKDTEMRNLMYAADVNNRGTIDYGEFVVASIHLYKLDGSGYKTEDKPQPDRAEHGMTDYWLENLTEDKPQPDRAELGMTDVLLEKLTEDAMPMSEYNNNEISNHSAQSKKEYNYTQGGKGTGEPSTSLATRVQECFIKAKKDILPALIGVALVFIKKYFEDKLNQYFDIKKKNEDDTPSGKLIHEVVSSVKGLTSDEIYKVTRMLINSNIKEFELLQDLPEEQKKEWVRHMLDN